MTAPATPELTAEEVATLAATADLVLPPEEGMPVPSQVLADGRLLGVAVNARADQADLVRQACQGLKDPSTDVVGLMFQQQPEAMDAAANVIAGAYFMDHVVRSSIGYPGQIRRPATLEEAVDDLGDDILDPVLERGPIYRPTP